MANHILNVHEDLPDSRDWIYQPSLAQLKTTLEPPDSLKILDQKSEGACTGFALAAAINHLNQREGRELNVSARMLYEMAKRHDEWAGTQYHGSSLRGAIHGWKNMGVCSDQAWPYFVSNNKRGRFTIARAKDARNQTIGAYYRLRPEISDFHAALNETGIIIASAMVHKGWDETGANGVIKPFKTLEGGHAFAIVGYNDKGFWVQNSWGEAWGVNGLALWLYQDWIANLMDAWVFRLALPTPQIFGMRPVESKVYTENTGRSAVSSAPPRNDIAGHFVHIDDGQFQERGRYWSADFDVEQTAELVAASDKYDHILFYAHGGLNSPKDSARRIKAMKPVFKGNRIYPFHFMYDTGLAEELGDLIQRKTSFAYDRTGGVADLRDEVVEFAARKPGQLLWNEMKRDAKDAFSGRGAGTESAEYFIKHIGASDRPRKFHFVGHSSGAIVIAWFLARFADFPIEISTCQLLAPAVSNDMFLTHYLPALSDQQQLQVRQLLVYNLCDELEQNDSVGSNLVYGKSLLYLVSNAFEKRNGRALLGMEKFNAEVPARDNIEFIYSNGISGSRCRTRTHAGFDNDLATMNSVLKTILDVRTKQRFTQESLKY